MIEFSISSPPPKTGPFRSLVPGKLITQQESFPEGCLITFDDGSEAVYPSLPSNDPDPRFVSYMEMFPNDPETHLDPDAFADRQPLCLHPEVLRMRYPERRRKSP